MSSLILPYAEHRPRIAEGAFVAPDATVIGNVEIGEGSGIWYKCVLRGDVHEIRIGRRSNIQDGTVLHVSGGKFGTYVGDEVTIGHMALIHGCRLETGCFVGMRATVMDGVVVEGGAMVAAGAVVTPGKRVPRGELWGGSPAKLLRPLSEEEVAGFPKVAERYARLAQEHGGLRPL